MPLTGPSGCPLPTCFYQVPLSSPPQCKTEIHKNSFFPRTIIDWNHLDDNIVRAETVDSFRKAVHHWD